MLPYILVTLPPSQLFKFSQRSRSRCRHHGFTLVETALSIAILSVFCAFAYGSMLMSNRQAMINRLYTLAEEMARDQIDLIETAGPYNPQFKAPLGPQIPAVLDLDTTRADPPHGIASAPLSQTRPLYVDPATGNTVINATLSTSIVDAGGNNTRAATVTVSYNFYGKPYTVTMNTLRTSDS